MKETQFLDMWNVKPTKDIKTFKPQNVGCTSFLGASPDRIAKCSCHKKRPNRGEVSLFKKRCAELGRCSY